MIRRLARPAAALAVLPAGAAALFHLRLVRAVPAANATVATPPAAVRLWFSQPAEVAVTRVRLVGAAGPVALAPPVADSGGVRAAVRGTLRPGAYTVEWRTMAGDGHAVSGRYAFRVGAASAAR